MPRPKLLSDKDVLRLILESEYYLQTSGKWISNKKVRDWIAFKLKTSESTVLRTQKKLIHRGILEATPYRGTYYINEKKKNKRFT